MNTFGKIILASIALGCIEQVVKSISEAARPNPKVEEKK
ncbi:hypothetical protein [Pseudomonas phage D6]|nr:hypothetical protein [Pseudomonas phage D6]